MAVSYFKISSFKNISARAKTKYWMKLGKTIDRNIYTLVCTIIIPLVLLINIEKIRDEYFYIIPIIIAAIILNFQKREG